MDKIIIINKDHCYIKKENYNNIDLKKSSIYNL